MFRTYEPARDRLVAVKAFRLDLTPEQARALADELQRVADASLDHPSIVMTLGAGIEGTVAYAASEYVAAESLDVALRHYAPASLETVLPFMTQIAGAIDFARTAGIGHGALHPRDVFVTPDEARATGFGVVQALEKIGARAPVRRPYTAPERVEAGGWDVRADVYSLGAIAFELITARRPVGADIGGLGATGGPHAAAVAAVLSRALADDPAARFPTALAFVAAFEAASRGEGPTGVVAAVPAAVETGVAPVAPEEPELHDEPDIGEERDTGVEEIQLREAEIEREAERPSSAAPSLFDLDLDGGTEDVIPGVQHTGFPHEAERRLDASVEPVEPIEPIEPIEPAAPPPRPRPRPVLLPVALTLLLGLFVGFLAGYLVGSGDRAPVAAPERGAAATATGPKAEVASQPRANPPARAAAGQTAAAP
ncbi:MAG: protein kinase, partial [Acidobacteria bacterium]|nr:protein kinase [Acidobacteriota bacterium]